MQNVMQALYLTRNARGLPASARRYTHTLVKYARLKRKTDLILGILYLAMCLTFLAFFVLRLVEVKG